jgi:hypothetical protein
MLEQFGMALEMPTGMVPKKDQRANIAYLEAKVEQP